MAGPYNFHQVLVSDIGPGGSVRTLRNGKVTVRSATGIAPADAGTGAVIYNLTSDASGTVTFTTGSTPVVDLVAPSGFVKRVTSPDALTEAASAATSAANSASAAQASANSSAASAALVGAPADSAIAAAVNGTGSSSRAAIDNTWQREQTFDVRKYGAKGDGTTDDRAAIQSAIDAATTAGGGTVYLPKGIFLLGGTLNLTSGVHLRGQSRRTTTLKVSALNVSAVTILGASVSSTIVQTGMSNLALSGPGKAAGGTGSGVYIKWASVDVCLDQLWITNWGKHGIESVDSYSMTFRQTLLDSNGGDGFNGTTNQNNLTFDRTISINNAGRGYSVTGGTTCVFLNADAESNAGAGFDLRYVFAGSLLGCHMEKNGSDGTSPNVYLHYRTGLSEKATATTIQGCVIQGSSITKRGIVVDGASRTNIMGNWFAGHVTEHYQTTSNADRTWVGPNTYTTGIPEYTDSSASTVRMDYDYANLCARTDVMRFIPRATNPAVLAEGQVWYSSTDKKLKFYDGTAVRTVTSS